MDCCDSCLRRTVLLGVIAPAAEKAIADSPGRRTRELLALPDAELAAAVHPKRASRLLDEAESCDLARLRADLDGAGVWARCRHSPEYPAALRPDPQAPVTLLGRGDISLLGKAAEAAVTVVGSRRPSSYGFELARSLAVELAGAGLVVISGMAMGIDSSAHEAALEAGGATIAVLGSGPDVPHPPSKRRLYDRIVSDGLVISELPPGTRPYRWTFPARNRIMAALGQITVVVEAASRSGSLITAGMASDLGREVGAVPGRVGTPLAEGTNALLADGAVVVRGGQDVLDAIFGPSAPQLEQRLAPALSPEQAAVLELVGRGHESPDEVAAAAGMDVGSALAALTALELLGRLRSDSGGHYAVASGGARAPS